jgi:hypothetical protein
VENRLKNDNDKPARARRVAKLYPAMGKINDADHIK